jgi:hypothetical protein
MNEDENLYNILDRSPMTIRNRTEWCETLGFWADSFIFQNITDVKV